MRALLVCTRPRWDGATRAFAAAARGLAEHGWDVTCACDDGAGSVRGQVEGAVAAAGVVVLPLPADASALALTSRLRHVIASRRPDVVYVHGERGQLAAATALWRTRHVTLVRRVGAGEQFTAGRAARTATRFAPPVALLTWPEQAASADDVGALRHVVADVGVGPAQPVPSADEWLDERRLVCVCDASGHARAATVLRAVALLAPRHRELRLVLAGPGAHDEQLRLHAAALGIHRLVRHLPPGAGVADDAAARASAHVGWVTADCDDGAFGALDFMAAGVPLIAERGGVAARYVPDGIAGVHVNPADVPATAAALAALLARDDERLAMGNAGRVRVARAFSEAAMVDGFVRAAELGASRRVRATR